jgi:hypothetical protein
MKFTPSFIILLLSICFLVSCEKSDLQTSLLLDQENISTRSDNCNSCPDCCCSILLTGGAIFGTTITLCGTTNLGSEECGFETTNCSVINGATETIFLTPGVPRKFFCMSPNSAFSIASSVVGAQVTITCQYGQTSPQTINITFGSPPKNYYSVNGDCEIEDDCF